MAGLLEPRPEGGVTGGVRRAVVARERRPAGVLDGRGEAGEGGRHRAAGSTAPTPAGVRGPRSGGGWPADGVKSGTAPAEMDLVNMRDPQG